jgi:hypothetical protein
MLTTHRSKLLMKMPFCCSPCISISVEILIDGIKEGERKTEN